VRAVTYTGDGTGVGDPATMLAVLAVLAVLALAVGARALPTTD
jgi:hypothetical protein